jgi:hypothetical protein
MPPPSSVPVPSSAGVLRFAPGVSAPLSGFMSVFPSAAAASGSSYVPPVPTPVRICFTSFSNYLC